MSKPLYSRAQHNAVDKVLAPLNGDFLARSKCFFGGGVDATLRAAARKLKKNQAYFKKCVTSLGITDLNTLANGLGRIVAPKW